MNQHVFRLETEYSRNISKSTIVNFLKVIRTSSQDIETANYKNIPIISRPHTTNYCLYEDIDLIRINLQKLLIKKI